MTEVIRLCTWNIQLGLSLDKILSAIRTHADFRDLDLLALQEASVRYGTEDSQVIAQALGPEFGHYQVTAHQLGKYTQANALIWNSHRVKATNMDSVLLPLAHEVKLSHPERVLLRSLPRQQRISLVVEGTLGELSMRVYVAHLDVVGFSHKREQFLRILDDSQTRRPAHITIIAGDMNTFKIRSRPSWSGMSEAAIKAGFQDLTDKIIWTQTIGRRWRQKLDAIFVNNAGPVDFRAWSLEVPGSDHIPVFAEFTAD